MRKVLTVTMVAAWALWGVACGSDSGNNNANGNPVPAAGAGVVGGSGAVAGTTGTLAGSGGTGVIPMGGAR